MKKYVLLLLVCFTVLLAGCTPPKNNNSGSSAPAGKQDVSYLDVKAEEMLREYIRDTGIAESKYKGQNIQLTGKLQRKGQFRNSSNFYAVLVSEHTLGRNYNIVVQYPVDKSDEINKLKYGDFVVARGECLGIIPQEDPKEISVHVAFGQVGDGTTSVVPRGGQTQYVPPAPGPTPPPPPPPAPPVRPTVRYGVITGTEVRLRADPGKTGIILGHFYKGEYVTVFEVTERWTRVQRNNGQIGWVSNDYCYLQ